MLIKQIISNYADINRIIMQIPLLLQISHLDASWIVQNSRRTYQKRKKRNKSPCIQTSLF